MTIKLTAEEVAALAQLRVAGDRGRTISGLKSRGWLSRLVKGRYVIEQSASMDTVVYVITDQGREALARAKH
jgi:predicted transcriptional regulator of viral defense system